MGWRTCWTGWWTGIWWVHSGRQSCQLAEGTPPNHIILMDISKASKKNALMTQVAKPRRFWMTITLNLGFLLKLTDIAVQRLPGLVKYLLHGHFGLISVLSSYSKIYNVGMNNVAKLKKGQFPTVQGRGFLRQSQLWCHSAGASGQIPRGRGNSV